MDFNKELKKLKKIHLAFLVVGGFAFVILYLLKTNKIIENVILTNSNVNIVLQSVGILLTLGLVVLAYHYYSKVLKINKNNSQDEVLESSYLKAKKVQNTIIYSVVGLNLLLFVLTFQKQFELLTVISLVICAINFPKKAQFLQDYKELEEVEN